MKYFAAHEGSKHTAICKETHKSLVKSNLDLSRLEREKKKYWEGYLDLRVFKGYLSFGSLMLINCCHFSVGLRE